MTQGGAPTRTRPVLPLIPWSDGEEAVIALWATRVRQGRVTRACAARRLHTSLMSHRTEEAILRRLYMRAQETRSTFSAGLPPLPG